MNSGALQAKLAIGHPGDKYEREADRVAEAVMRMPAPQAAIGGAIAIEESSSPGGEGGLRCQKDEEEKEKEDEEHLQTKRPSGQNGKIGPDLEPRINAFRGGGQPLAESERRFFEPRFGCDFSRVRVHTGVQAAESARALGARAFTVGSDLVFGASQYDMQTMMGRTLLAHELTHVMQ